MKMLKIKNSKIEKLVTGALCGIAIASFCGVSTSAKAAETLVVRYGLLEESVSIDELKITAQTGKLPDSLGTFTKRMTEEQRRALVGSLRAKVPMNVVTLDKLINTQIGNTILSDISTIFKRQDDAGVKAMKAGLILGANSPQGLSVLSFIEAYPSKRLEINLPQAINVLKNLNGSFFRTQQFMLAISPQLNPRNVQASYTIDPSQSGNAKVETLNLKFTDEKRQRQIPVDIYYSGEVTADKPLVVFSHGLGSVKTDLRYLGEHLASHGYVVAALEHPGSNEINVKAAIKGKKRIVEPQEFLERPKDVSFILDELAKINETNNSQLQGKLATNNVMFVGYSFGGATALVLAGGELQIDSLKQNCQKNLAQTSLGEGVQCIAQELPENSYQVRDVRIKQAIAFNPTSSLLFGQTGLTKVEIPTLIFTSSADKTTPALTEQVMGFAKIPSPKWLVAAIGATHLSIKDPSTTLDQANKTNTPLFGKEIVGEDAKDVRQFVKAITLAMAAQQTPQAQQYQPFLTSDYAQIASTKLFPFRTVRQLPPNILEMIK
jgi:predicted dienelactone hydrolase